MNSTNAIIVRNHSNEKGNMRNIQRIVLLITLASLKKMTFNVLSATKSLLQLFSKRITLKRHTLTKELVQFAIKNC